MSIEPPKTESSGGLPGMVIPLAFVSVLLLAAVLVFGALAFDVGIPGLSEDEPEVAAPAAPQDVMELSGFIVRESRVENEMTIVEVEVSVINTSEQPVDAFQVLVQCDDDGYVSAIQNVSGIEPGEDRTIAMELAGRGEPSCHSPIVEFTDQRSGR